MKKRLTALSLSAVMAFTMVGGGAIHAAAAPVGHGTYTPSEGVETYKYYFAMPGSWINDSTHENNDVAGVYWWSAPDDPDTKFGHGWPGYEMDKEDGYENLWSVNAPRNASILVFNNYLDRGMDSTLPIFKNAQQCRNKNVEYYKEGDADTYSQKFWEYMWTKAAKQIGIDTEDPGFDYKSDEVYKAMIDPANADKIDFSDEFGEYGKNFFAELENETGLAMNFQNMVYVVDLDPAHIMTVNEDLIPGGKPAYNGEFYFYYGNGEYGMWPTKSMALEMEGVTDNGDGTYTGGARVDDYGTVFNADGQVVIGNFTKKYSINETASTEPKKIYFHVPTSWENYKDIRLYLYEVGGDELIPWNSKIGKMTDEGDGRWSYDLAENGYILSDSKTYACSFLTNTELQTCDLFIGNPCIGDTAYFTGKRIENPKDPNKKNWEVKWFNADSYRWGVPLAITSIGNVGGYALPTGTTKYDIFLNFLKDTGKNGIDNAVKFNGKTIQQTIDDLAVGLGFSLDDIKKAIKESGRTNLYWKESDSPLYSPGYENVTFIADYLSQYYTSPAMCSVDQINTFLKNLNVTKDEVAQEIYKRNYGFDKFNAINAILSQCTNPGAITIGDVNSDGTVNGADAGVLSRFAAGWKGYEDKIKNMTAADINGDSVVNGADAGILARYTSGWKQYDKYFS